MTRRHRDGCAAADEALQAHVGAGDDVLENLERAGFTIDQAAAAIVDHWLADRHAWNLPVLVAAARRMDRRTAPLGRARDRLERSGLFQILRAAGRRERYIEAAAARDDDDVAQFQAGFAALKGCR